MNHLNRVADALALIGAALLLVVCAIVSLDVVMRWLLAMVMPGRVDIERLTIAVALIMGFPIILLANRGVSVRFLGALVGRYSPRGARVMRAFSILCSVAFFTICVWQLYRVTLDAKGAGEVMLVLPVPVWPFWAAVTVGLALSVVAALAALFRPDADIAADDLTI